MWCRICGQDVPGIPSFEEGEYSCARCGEQVAPISQQSTIGPQSASAAKKEATKGGAASTAARRPPIYDGWEIDEQLRHLRRVLGRAAVPDGTADQPKFRLDAGHGVPLPHMKRTRRPSRKSKRAAAAAKEHASGDRLLAALAWTALFLGTVGFGCGLGLLGWSMNTGRQDLWTIGTPIILAGQIVLVLGLVLQLDRIWSGNRRAATRLETVDEQIHDLKAATTLLGTTHGPSSAFYAHWAGGAGAEILLSDLKSQLDLLAVKLSK
jgi:transcription initiation factor TFIIIB Brf1 subunit/transcription initiation factor TFIIB